MVADTRIIPHPHCMQVALVTDTFPPDLNGVSLTMDRLRRGLEARGHRVNVIRPSGDSGPLRVRRRETGVRSLPVPGYPGLRFGMPSWWRLWRLWSARRPDVVYVATEGPLGWAAAALARRLRIPVASGFHTNFDEYLRVRHLPRLVPVALRSLRRFHNGTAMTLAPSRDVMSRLQAQGFRNLRILSRGVDAELFHPSRRDPALRTSWGVGPGPVEPPVFLLAGRLAPEKNLPFALETMKQLTAGRGHVVVVGDGPDRAALESRFAFARFTGALRGEELARHYASADVLLFPSLTETFGNVLLEAMASGLLTISYDYAASAEHVVDGRNGWKVPAGDHNAFAGRLAAALALPAAQRTALGTAARHTAEGLGWDRVIHRFEELLTAASSSPNHESTP
jgi:glycosyltransferase involved in cell wall biosynthesis